MSIEQWVINPGETRVIDLELVRRLKVGLIGGKVDVIAHDEPGARVEISGVTGKDLKVSIVGDVLEIDHPQLGWDNFIDVFKGWAGNAKADVSILAPRHVALKLGMVSGDALIAGFTTDGKISTVSGSVVVDNHEGDLDVSSVSGEISIGNHVGAIDAHSVSGDVVATGDIYGFDADTVSGNMIVDAQGTPGKIDTNTVSGSLTVRYDAGAGARYRINTVGGTVLLDDTRIKGVLGKGFERVTGELAGRWLDLAANSVSGSISVMTRARTGATGGAGATDAGGSADAEAGAQAGGAGAERDAEASV
ncbi:hypothetical protein SAMN05428970_3897 [Agromyces sp. CF514]|uniref:DUF4097 family beta strand repeat-containing protein n=1 Tax=Agromyces sp. CF514 TaxID=1881031 RepID=UPI0008EAA042|nr:hypothetical protein [Agromyces sp. CF514]SFR92188.1 hypothetical protein SAMN05428970_3897 [Agromyces sp. CF514]